MPIVILAVDKLLVRSASLKPAGPVIETESAMAVPACATPLMVKATLPTVPKEKFTLLGAPAPLVGQLEPPLGVQDQVTLFKPVSVVVNVALVAVVEPRLVTVTRKVPMPPEAEGVFWVMAKSGRPSVK